MTKTHSIVAESCGAFARVPGRGLEPQPQPAKPAEHTGACYPKRRSTRILPGIAAVVMCGMLAACETRVIDSTCAWDQPITYSSSKDTPETVAQIRSHNAGLIRICPQMAPR